MVRTAEAARLTGASIKAIRIYENLRLIQPARRDNHRYFDPATLEILRCIKLAQTLGFSLKEMQQLVQSDGRWNTSAFNSMIALRKQAIHLQMAAFQTQLAKLDALALDVQNPHFCDVSA